MKERALFVFSLGLLFCVTLFAAPPPDKRKEPKVPPLTIEEGLPVGEFYAIAFSPDGRYLATGLRWSHRYGLLEERSVDILNPKTGKLYGFLNPGRPYEGTPVALAFSPDGRFLAIGAMDRRVYLWDVKAGKLVRKLVLPAPIEAIAFSPDGKLLSVGDWDGKVRVFRGKKGWAFPFLFRTVQVLTGDLWRRPPKLPSVKKTPKIVEMLRLKNPPFVKAIVFDPKGEWMAVAGTGEVVGAKEGIVVFSTRTWKRIAILKGHGKGVKWRLPGGERPRPWVNDLSVSQDGRFLVSAGWDGTVRVWDMEKFRQVRKLSSPKTPLGRIATRIYNGVAFSPDGRLVAAGGFGRRVDVWEWQKGRLITTLWAEKIVETVAFSPDGRMLLVGGWDGSLRAWSVGPWRLRWRYTHPLLPRSLRPARLP